ncbi:hypothetical protein BC835DRAFT_1412646 [Cytidiella melzeri]|nr:hypothetical protein BC835DRAFT_1412646 [Cytidiella melzeri]
MADVILLVVTLVKTAGTFRSANAVGLSSSLSTLMMRDSTLYFMQVIFTGGRNEDVRSLLRSVFLILNISQMIVEETTGKTFVGPFITVITSILSSRFILNLRWTAHHNFHASNISTLSVPTLQFRRSLIGNLDESLHSGYDEREVAHSVAPASDQEDHSRLKLSDDPLQKPDHNTSMV